MITFYIDVFFRRLLVLVLDLKLGTHGIRGDGRQVEDAHWVTGVDGLGANVTVGVAQVATQRLGETNLGTGVQEALAGQNGIRAELTKVLGRHHLLGDQAHVGVGRRLTNLKGAAVAAGERRKQTVRHCAAWHQTGRTVIQRTTLSNHGTAGWGQGLRSRGDSLETATLGHQQHERNQSQQNQNCETFTVHIYNGLRLFLQVDVVLILVRWVILEKIFPGKPGLGGALDSDLDHLPYWLERPLGKHQTGQLKPGINRHGTGQ